jgi:hypothetical protein
MVHYTVDPQSRTHARNGAPKKLTVAAPVVGHRSRIGASHPYLHGVPAQTNTPIKSHEKPIPVHAGMTPKQKARHEAISDPAGVFADATKLGK